MSACVRLPHRSRKHFLENVAQLILGADPRVFPNTAVIPSVTYNVGGLNISLTTIVTLAVAVGIGVAVGLGEGVAVGTGLGSISSVTV